LWEAFRNLTTRFQYLLTCSFFPLKINSFDSQEEDDRTIFAGTLVYLIKHLSNLNTLSVAFLSFDKSGMLSSKETHTYASVSKNNKITKVNLETVNERAHIQFLLELCPFIKYLELNHWSHIDHDLLVRFVLTQKIPHLHSLGLHIKNDVDAILVELKQ
jgi:hypothetical protein